MDIAGIAVVVMAVTLVVLAGVMIPACIEIRKTAVASRETLARIEAELRPVLHELRETLADAKLIVEETAANREDVTSFMGALGDTGRSLRTINSVAGSVAGVLASSSLWLTGAKVAGTFMIDKFLRK
ncbi:MAG: DUF948 domain-containing protein, partial [Geobacter sp.]|nr:DUF948 domain-containing protein [Geobacter sp.]